MSVFATGFDGATRFAGTIGKRYRAVAADYTANVAEDFFIDVNATAAARTITLPPVAKAFSDACGMVFFIRNATGTNTVTIEGDGAETIDGSANLVLSAQYATALLVCNGTGWMTMSNADIAAATDLTLSGTLAVTGTSTLSGATTVDDTLDVTGLTTLDDLVCVDITSTGAVDLSGATVTFAADAVDSADIADGAIDEVHMATTRARTVASDGALTLAATDSAIALLASAAGTKAATMTATHNGHRIRVILQAASGGEYTLAASYAGGAGTVTLDAAGEGVELMRVGAAWLALELIGGATHA